MSSETGELDYEFEREGRISLIEFAGRGFLAWWDGEWELKRVSMDELSMRLAILEVRSIVAKRLARLELDDKSYVESELEPRELVRNFKFMLQERRNAKTK